MGLLVRQDVDQYYCVLLFRIISTYCVLFLRIAYYSHMKKGRRFGLLRCKYVVAGGMTAGRSDG